MIRHKNKDLGTEHRAKIGPHQTQHKMDGKTWKKYSKLGRISPKGVIKLGEQEYELKFDKSTKVNHTRMVQPRSKLRFEHTTELSIKGTSQI